MLPYELLCELVEIPGVYNARDLGGYCCEGGVTAHNVFIRTGSLGGIAPAGRERLRALAVGLVLDLRSSNEVELAPDDFAAADGIDYLHMPLLDQISSNFVSGDFGAFPTSLEELYIGLLDLDGGIFARILTAIADERYQRVLFHCTAGKDRTGLVSMLLLGLAGVADDVIARDYSYSEYLLRGSLGGREGTVPEFLLRSDESTMAGTIAHLREKYGGIRQYIATTGVEQPAIDQILKKLVKAG